MSASEQLIDHALGLEWDSTPVKAQEAAKTFLHDTLCVGAAGANALYADAVRQIAGAWGAGGACAILGRPGLTLPPPQAAFVNAFQIHAQEFDAVHERAVLHPFAVTVAALLAEVDRGAPYRGADFLAALVGGVDVAVSLGLAARSPLKFFRPATTGIFGAVAALARLKRLPRHKALDAFGYALAFASGTMQAHVEGKPALPIQVANAARGAIAAIDIAEAGLPGPLHSIDGPFGYLTLFETKIDAAPILESLGRIFRITEVSWKPFPTGRAAHGGIAATQILMQEHGVNVENLLRLTYSAPPLIKRLVGRPAVLAMEPAYARLCFPFLAAVTLKSGGVNLTDFSAARLSDPSVLDIAARISVEDDGTPDPAIFVPGSAVAHLKDGRAFSVTIQDQLGSPEYPLSRRQHLQKAEACLAYAGLSGAHASLISGIEQLPSALDSRSVLRLACDG